MQQFDDQKGERRLLDIKNMKVREVADYYLQYLELEQDEKNKRKSQLKERIKQNKKVKPCEWILAIKSKDGKIIGKIEAMDMGNRIVFVTINLPNKSWKIKYGVEALDQFIKICKENKYFSKIQLEKYNSIVEKYVETHKKDDEIKSYEIEVA